MKRCRSCDAPITWVQSVSGSWMPLEERDGGGIVITSDLFGSQERAVVLAPGQGTHQSHFVSCPDAKEWRR